MIDKFLSNRGQAATEMAITLPIVLFIIMGCMTLGFMIYDKSVLVLATSQSAKMGSFILSDETKTVDEKTNEITQCAESFLTYCIGGNTEDIDIKLPENESETDIIVTIKYKYEYILPFLSDVFSDDGVMLEHSTKCYIQ